MDSALKSRNLVFVVLGTAVTVSCLTCMVIYGFELLRPTSEMMCEDMVKPLVMGPEAEVEMETAAPATKIVEEHVGFNKSAFIIPPIVHQSWKSTEVPSLTIADGREFDYHKWIRSWSSLNEHWEYMFWTDQDNDKLFETHPRLEPYKSTFFQHGGVTRSDYARYAYLYLYGGVYADIDFECLRPFDPIAKSFDLFLSSEPTDQTMALFNEPQMACNAIMGSKAFHPFWLKVLDDIKSSIEKNDCGHPVNCSGPRMLQRVYMQYVSEAWEDHPVTMLPSQYFYPERTAWNEKIRKGCQRLEEEGKYICRKSEGAEIWNSFAVHHWACTWCRGHDARKKEDVSEIVSADQFRRPFP
eukprot:TRINITY_DN51999_c0_g1_i1.p1 TRINITY_DN51999_c0_g1~~TRINITY_DN51999_c0_g1_i1.p1  ORF type:complete len:364 (+),score=63.11 TRINITY_DN51999_c0_g1_i1:28-1092(+)